jgi:CubicO group peptidase (beta-lactamase class C family)
LNVTCSCDLVSDYPYYPPEALEDGLQVGTLEDVRIDTQLILKAAERIRKGKYREVHSLLIYKDNMLVFEEYFQGHDYQWDAPRHNGNLVTWDSHMPHHVHSVSKSITSLCVGIAIEKGFIQDVHQSIFYYLPEYQYLKTEENQGITIENLLTGTSGLQWAEWSAPLSSMKNDQIAIYFHEQGPADFVLQRPMITEPGTHFIYSGGNIDLLGMIIENASGMSFEEFSEEYLFEPMGLDQATWDLVYPTGEYSAASGLIMTPREMVKVGAMMLNDGVWKSKVIISKNWVEKCRYPFPACTHISIPGEDLVDMGYAYAWWTKQIETTGKEIHWYSANGWGGQQIIVLPELNTVVVFTGGTYTHKVKEYEIIEDFILPALVYR